MSERVRMECPSCGYKCTPQWLNDKAHCLKCQAVLRRRDAGAGAGAGVEVQETKRQLGEVSTYKHAAGSAMESVSAGCPTSPDGNHHWKFGKCSLCQKPQPAGNKSAPASPQSPSNTAAETAASKQCSKCQKRYTGHGAVCSNCRLFSTKRGSSIQCKICSSFFWGYGDSCEDCKDKENQGILSANKPGSTVAPATQTERNDRSKVECPFCGYKCVPQWLNDQAHCLKCQAVLKKQPNVHHEGEMGFAAGDETRRQAGEVSTHKHAAGSAMESTSGSCPKAPDGMHHWKYGKCNYCQLPEGRIAKGPGVAANPGGAAAGCSAGGKCMFKFAKCTKCGKRSY